MFFLWLSLIAKGIKFVLVPLYLGPLYARMDECAGNITREVGRYDVVTHAHSSFLQVFIWERSPVIVLMHTEFPTVVMK